MHWLPALFAATVAAADVPTKLPAPPVAGREHYAEHCWACHGKRALGDGPSRSVLGSVAPSLAGLDASRHDEARAVILQGRGAMPGYGAVLSPDEASHILLWLSDLDPTTGDDPHRVTKKKKAAPDKPKDAPAAEAEAEAEAAVPTEPHTKARPSDRSVVVPPQPTPETPNNPEPASDGVL